MKSLCQVFHNVTAILFPYDAPCPPYSVDSAIILGYMIHKNNDKSRTEYSQTFFYGELSHDPACGTIKSGH